jgi:3-oxoadipate enol-lactonase
MAVAHAHDHWISWQADGPPAEVPVLMIMGLGGSSRAWYRLLPHLRNDHLCITFDNRGTGDSDRVRGPLRMRDLVGDTLAVLDAAGFERAHLIGFSMGGMIAQHLALEHRDRVASLVIGCTTAVQDRSRPPWRFLGGSALRAVLGAERTWPLLTPTLYAERTRREHPERIAEDLSVRLADAAPARTVYAQMAALAGHDLRARLPQLAGLPTLVLHGAEDRLVPPARGRELAQSIPGAELVLLPRCGHMLSTDCERSVARAIRMHLEADTIASPAAA